MIDAAAQQRNVSQWLVLALVYVIGLVCVGLLIYCHLNGEPFNVAKEDGLLEWGSVFFFVLSAVLCAAALFIRREALGKSQRRFLVIFLILLLAGAGEELSWGQRLFGFSPPRRNDSQVIQFGHGDAAVHNLSFKSKYVRFSVGGALFGPVLIAALFVHGVLYPWARKREYPWAVALTNRFGVFIPAVHLGWFVVALAIVFQFKRHYNHTESREFKEFVIPMVYSAMLLVHYLGGPGVRERRVRRGYVAVVVAWLIASLAYFPAHTQGRFDKPDPRSIEPAAPVKASLEETAASP